jgi:adenylylsulfate kinase
VKDNLKHQGKVIWLTGLSGAGKTTLANGLQDLLNQHGYLTKVLDGDVVRVGLNKDLKFSEADRNENIRRVAEVSKLFIAEGIITINSFISPTKKMREQARLIVGDSFIEVYVNTPIDICEMRDVKGLYVKARNGEINNFTGIGSIYEAPINPEIEILTELTVKETVIELSASIIKILNKN